jgi:hypothetical protein
MNEKPFYIQGSPAPLTGGIEGHGVLQYEETLSSVWHYTDVYGLQGIVMTDTLWASSTLALNDHSEVTHGLEVLKEVWRSYPSADMPGDFVQSVEELIEHGDLERLLSEDVFVVSASKDSDSLNQWQGYARAQGYAIEIEPQTLIWWPKDGKPSPGVQGWYDVIYDPEEKRRAAIELFAALHRYYAFHPEIIDGPGSFVSQLLGTLAVRFKHHAFKVEQEARYICWTGRRGTQHYRPGSRGLVPYLELSRWMPYRRYEGKALDSLRIGSVKCGPTRSDERAAVEGAVRGFLVMHGYESVRVSSSEIPYRF